MLKPVLIRKYLPNGALAVIKMEIPHRSLPRVFPVLPGPFTPCPIVLRQLSSYNRDLPYLPSTSPTSCDNHELSRDILLEKIKSASDSGEIFESIKLHLSIMNPSHQFMALNMLFQLEKSGNSKVGKKAIAKSSEFQSLCKHLSSKVQTFRTEDVMTILKCLSYFEVHSKSKLMQSVLHLIASNINELSLPSIMFLDFLLCELPKSPLVDALKISLPIVFQAQYHSRVHHETSANLIDMLAFSTRKQLSDDVVCKLLDTLVERNDIEYNERNAKSIVMSIVHCKSFKSVHGILLKRTLMWMAQNLNQFKFEDVENLTARLINKYVWVDDIFYHEVYLNAVIEHLIEGQHDFNDCMLVLKKLTRIHFVSKPLVEHMAVKAYSNPAQLENITPGASITFVAACSDSDYKPPHWEMIQAYFLHNFENSFASNDKIELPWIKIALEFASLDIFPPFLYEKIFNSEFLEKYVRANNVLDYFQLLNLHQANRTLNPHARDDLDLPRHLVDKALQYHLEERKESPSLLLAALERGLGGPQLVLSKVFSKHYHKIDYLIAMRKGGYPIPLQGSNPDSSVPMYLEDIRATLPEGAYLIAVTALPSSAFTLNTSSPRGVTRMFLRSLSTLDVAVLPVNVDQWASLPEVERIPYLMREMPRDGSQERTYCD